MPSALRVDREPSPTAPPARASQLGAPALGSSPRRCGARCDRAPPQGLELSLACGRSEGPISFGSLLDRRLPASADALVKVIQEALPNREGVLVLAANQDKDVPAILSRLLPTFSKCILTKFDSNPRAMPVDSLAEMVATIQSNRALPNIEVFTEEDTITAWEKARTMATHDSYICATGSFFLAAELRSHIRNTA